MTYWRAHTKEAWGVGGVAHLHVPFVYNVFVTVGRFESKSKRASRRLGLSLSLTVRTITRSRIAPNMIHKS